MKDRLVRWISEPLIIPRWMLTAKYVFFVVLGTLAAIAGVPSIDLTTWTGYTTFWAFAVTGSAGVAAWASVSRGRETAEKWGVVSLVALLGLYLFSAWSVTIQEADLGRIIFTWLVTGITMLPAVRAADLLWRQGTRHAD